MKSFNPTARSNTLANRFILKAVEIMPHHAELQRISGMIDNRVHIDAIMFAKGEYIGGMASVLLALIEADIQNENGGE